MLVLDWTGRASLDAGKDMLDSTVTQGSMMVIVGLELELKLELELELAFTIVTPPCRHSTTLARLHRRSKLYASERAAMLQGPDRNRLLHL